MQKIAQRDPPRRFLGAEMFVADAGRAFGAAVSVPAFAARHLENASKLRLIG